MQYFLKECAGLVVAYLSASSADAIDPLQSCFNCECFVIFRPNEDSQHDVTPGRDNCKGYHERLQCRAVGKKRRVAGLGHRKLEAGNVCLEPRESIRNLKSEN